MESLMIIILVIIIIICTIAIFYATVYNKFQDYIIRINEVESIIDNNLRKINQGKTIGIIICKKENMYVIEYCSDDRIIAREYELI